MLTHGGSVALHCPYRPITVYHARLDKCPYEEDDSIVEESYMNRSSCAAISVSIVVAFSGTVAFAQTVISAHSGLIHYVEGRVLLDGKPVEVKITNFPEVKENM